MRFSTPTMYSFNWLAKAFAAMISAAILAGCASPAPPRTGPAMDEIYSKLNRQGQRDTVEIMRRGIRQNLQGGVTDPVYPMRRPDQIVPVWRPSYVNPNTGRKEGGQWVYIVDEPSGWVE